MEHQELLVGSIQLHGRRMIEDRARHGYRRGPARLYPTLRVMERKPRLESLAEPAGPLASPQLQGDVFRDRSLRTGARQAAGSAS